MTRTEKLSLRLGLEKSQCDRHKENLSLIPMNSVYIMEGDVLWVDYTLKINYLGDIDVTLGAIERILDDPYVVRSVSSIELNYSKCLIQSILLKLERIEMANKSGFSRLAAAIKTHWYKKKMARANRKALHQTKDIEEHRDTKLNPWSLD